MAASSGDAHPWPIYNARYRIVFPILDADGDLVTAAAGLDSELSQDQGAFADATNEATEIATSSGMYYLDLIATELDTKCTAIIVKTTTTGAKTTPIVLYPQRFPVIRTGTAQAGGATSITLDSGASAVDDYYNGCYVNITNDLPVNALGQARRITDYVGVTKVATVEAAWGTNPSSASTFEILLPGDTTNVAQWAGTAVNDPATAGIPDVSVQDIQANAITATAIATGAITAAKFGAGAIDAAAIATGAIDADAIADNAIDAGAIATGAITAAKFAAGAIDNAAFNVTETLTANPAAGGITSASFAAGAIDAAAIAAGAIGVSEAPNLDAAISTRATPAQVNTEVLDVLNVDTFAEPAQGAPAATTTLVNKIGFLYKFLRNRITQTATTMSVYNDDAITVDHKSTVSDDGTTYDRGEIVTGP